MEEAKQCPFCGGNPVVECSGSVYGRFWYSVGCNTCDVWMRDRERWEDDKLTLPEGECINRWNKRREN